MRAENENIKLKFPNVIASNENCTISYQYIITEPDFGEYNKYAIDTLYNFPNLDIIFEGDNAKLYEVIIKDGNDEIAWRRKTKGNYTVDTDFLSNGPLGAFNFAEITKKADTEATTFTFNNKWTMINLDT